MLTNINFYIHIYIPNVSQTYIRYITLKIKQVTDVYIHRNNIHKKNKLSVIHKDNDNIINIVNENRIHIIYHNADFYIISNKSKLIEHIKCLFYIDPLNFIKYFTKLQQQLDIILHDNNFVIDNFIKNGDYNTKSMCSSDISSDDDEIDDMIDDIVAQRKNIKYTKIKQHDFIQELKNIWKKRHEQENTYITKEISNDISICSDELSDDYDSTDEQIENITTNTKNIKYIKVDNVYNEIMDIRKTRIIKPKKLEDEYYSKYIGEDTISVNSDDLSDDDDSTDEAIQTILINNKQIEYTTVNNDDVIKEMLLQLKN
jgi:hypothetical protein